MKYTETELVEMLNAADKNTRLDALRELREMIERGELKATIAGNDVNNHVHTTYSFSPYSPTSAVWHAYRAGLKTVGIMDHDSIAGAREFLEAADIIGILATIGVECRVDMSKTPLGDKRFNNPDQEQVAYMALHGVPHQSIDRITEFFVPLTAERGVRNRAMTARINELMKPHDIALDYDADVVTISQLGDGGSVTERHLLFALCHKLTDRFGRGSAMAEFLKHEMDIPLSSNVEEVLCDAANPYYDYDLLGALKSDLVEKFYIPATDECPPVEDVLALGRETGAISAYAYLGDIEQSVTGDKKAQLFEDAFLDELFFQLKDLGYNAITYMPSRNTAAQLARLRELCDKFEFFQISGEDINTPRQSFICMAQRAPEFANLYEATMALIGHEQRGSADLSDGMFSPQTIEAIPPLSERIKEYYPDSE